MSMRIGVFVNQYIPVHTSVGVSSRVSGFQMPYGRPARPAPAPGPSTDSNREAHGSGRTGPRLPSHDGAAQGAARDARLHAHVGDEAERGGRY